MTKMIPVGFTYELSWQRFVIISRRLTGPLLFKFVGKLKWLVGEKRELELMTRSGKADDDDEEIKGEKSGAVKKMETAELLLNFAGNYGDISCEKKVSWRMMLLPLEFCARVGLLSSHGSFCHQLCIPILPLFYSFFSLFLLSSAQKLHKLISLFFLFLSIRRNKFHHKYESSSPFPARSLRKITCISLLDVISLFLSPFSPFPQLSLSSSLSIPSQPPARPNVTTAPILT